MQAAVNLREVGQLDDSSRLPLYVQIANSLSERIRTSQSELAGLLLPSEKEIEAHFQVSRPTVRQAMAQLHTEGLITRGRGRGTFVAPPRASRDLGRIVQFELMPPSRAIKFKLLDRERVEADSQVCALFRLDQGKTVERITRLRFIEGEIFAYEERFVPVDIAAKITNDALESEAGAIFVRQLINGENGNVSFRFSAIPAPAHLAKILKMKVDAPLLSSEHTYFASQDVPVLTGVIYFRGDRYDFGFRAPIHGWDSQ